MRKEPYAGNDFYRLVKKYVAVTVYIPRETRNSFKKTAKEMKRLGMVGASAQKLMRAALVRAAKRGRRGPK